MKIKKQNKKNCLLYSTVIIFAALFFAGSAKASPTGCSCYKSDKTAAGGNNNDISGASSTDQCNTICNGITGGSGYYDYRGVLNPNTHTVYFPITAISCTCYVGSTQYSVATASSDASCKTACKATSNTITAYSFGGNPTEQIAAPTVPAATSPNATSSAGPFQYQLLESFPGFFGAGTSPDFKTLILAIYKFGIWTVGIAGLFMLTIGGFMYMASAGNNATASNAKGIIEDAIIGIIAAMCAFLILYVINPDLTNLKIAFTAVTPMNAPSFGTAGTGSAATSGGAGTGNCTPMTTGACSVANLQNTCFGAYGPTVVNQASSICNKESGGVENKASGSDICSDGNVFSWGLFQVNITQWDIGLNCTKAFQGTNKNSSVINTTMYHNCVNALINPATNIKNACAIYKFGGWNQWGANKGNGGCGF